MKLNVSCQTRKKLLKFSSVSYRYFLKPLLFCFSPEFVHNHMTKIGESLGSMSVTKNILAAVCSPYEKSLEQTVAGIHFPGPIGLSAGFDYDAKLTQITPSLGFGFESIGTITNRPYAGNRKPILGRLPKSKSLMVNKGFKNMGADTISKKLSNQLFKIPVGISIGRTNTLDLKTQQDSIEDIIKAFKKFEKSSVNHSYYELNISCPNLLGDISFYPKRNLNELLTEIDNLYLKKPLFIKMPIEKSDSDVLEMLSIISTHTVTGIIIGNLQKDRGNKALIQKEVRKFPVGNFSGKPTFERSNELIQLAYRHFKNRFIIIGCGGIFNAKDAYLKIRLGATVVQLITGMIYEGPQLIAQINQDLKFFLRKDGYKNISEAIGTQNI